MKNAVRGWRLLAAVALLPALSDVATAQTGSSCADTIAAVMADIAARDLDTTNGPPLNAFLTLNPNALAQAQALDRAVAAGAPKGPLFCVPVAVKDNFDTYDMPMTVGSLALLGNQPAQDAAFVARLRAAGAIIVGKTNMDEFAMGIRGLSGAGGRVGNAYDTRQTAGGSSSGSAAAVGAGLVPFAIGSDNCGSLRLPAVYNGAVTLRATYGRFDTTGIFPIGFANGVPGVIAADTARLRTALAVVGDGWRPDIEGDLHGKRIGILRRIKAEEPWHGADDNTKALFAQGIALLRQAGADIIEDVHIADVDLRLGPEFIKGFARRVDASFATYPAARRNWRDICTSGRIRPEWNQRECLTLAASSPRQEQEARNRIARNQKAIVATLDLQRLDALLYPVDGRGGARADESPDMTCFYVSTAGVPAVAFPIGLDDRGMPVGLELLGRPGADEDLVSMMAAFETARGPLQHARRSPGDPRLARLDIARQNDLRRQLGWRAFQSRRGSKAMSALAPEPFRALTEETVKSALGR